MNQREIHLLENSTASSHFCQSQRLEASKLSFWGVGFCCSRIQNTTSQKSQGLLCQTTPQFLSSSMEDYIVEGRTSPFATYFSFSEQQEDPLQTYETMPWLLQGLHLSLFQDVQIPFQRYLHSQDLLLVRTPQEAIGLLLSNLFTKIQQISADCILIAFDSVLFWDYICAFFRHTKKLDSVNWPSNAKGLALVANELIYLLANWDGLPTIGLLPIHSNDFETWVSFAHETQKHPSMRHAVKFVL